MSQSTIQALPEPATLPSMNWPSLRAYLHWIRRQPLLAMATPHDAIRNLGGGVSVVLHRSGQYQTEMCIATQGWNFSEEHAHPNVDSFEVGLCGEIYLHLNGKRLVPDETVLATKADGSSALAGVAVRVRPGVMHGGEVGPLGGAFLSVQRWITGSPTSVLLDWQGSTLGELHEKMLVGK